MTFDIEFDPEAVKDLKELDRPIPQRLIGFLKQRVAEPGALQNAVPSLGRGGGLAGAVCVITEIQQSSRGRRGYNRLNRFKLPAAASPRHRRARLPAAR